MKKKIALLLTALLSLTCLAACGKEEASSPSASYVNLQEGVRVADSLQMEAPVFPENDFGKDNEATYPNAWN